MLNGRKKQLGMSFEVLETVYRQSDFRRSLNASKKKRIRKFVSDSRRKRFTLRTFCNATHLGMIAAPFLDAVVEESEALGKAISLDAHSFLLRKSTNFFCPKEDHDRLILEPDEDANGWCYICEKSYRLNDNLESELQYESNVEAYATIQTKPASLKSNIESFWQSLPSPLRWLTLAVLAAIIGIPITVVLTPPIQQVLSPPDTTLSPTDVHVESTKQTITVSTSKTLQWESVDRSSTKETPFSDIHTLPDARPDDLTPLTVAFP